MTDWTLLARARGLDIPADALEALAPALDSLEAGFRPLSIKLTPSVEPAITLSEGAVLAESRGESK